jgi:hypothetical protein
MKAVKLNSSSVKVVGANGQISLGKQFAGRQVLVVGADSSGCSRQ